MNWNANPQSYEELRALVLNVVLGQTCRQFGEIEEKVAQGILKRNNQWPPSQMGIAYQHAISALHPSDSLTILEIFWDLFRQGVITLGLNSSNPQWPWFRLSRFGQSINAQAPPRFHDTTSYVTMIMTYDPDISADGELYLEEAAASFYAECLLSASGMLGVAAEAEFLRLLNIASKSSKWGATFAPVTKELSISRKIKKFQSALTPHRKSFPHELTDDLDTNLSMIQSVLRLARNEAGHPSGKRAPTREQVYVNMQLFGPFIRQLAGLRNALA